MQEQRLEVFRTQLGLYFEPAEHGGAGAPLPLVKHVSTEFCGWPADEVESRLASLGHVADDAGLALFPAAMWRAVWMAAGVPSPHPTRCATVHTLRLRSSATAVFRSELEAKRLRAAKVVRMRQSAAGLATRALSRSAPPSPARGDGLLAAPNAALFEQFRFNA